MSHVIGYQELKTSVSTLDMVSCWLRHHVPRVPLNSGVSWGGLGGGSADSPPKKVKKDFYHSGESVLGLTFIRMM